MTIGATTYGIHGTNNRWSIGRTSTHGCIRMYEDVMEALYARVPEGTPVQLVYEPVKLGARDGRIYVEAHTDVYDRYRGHDLASLALARLDGLGVGSRVDREAVRRAVAEASGLPVDIGPIDGAPADGAPVDAAPSGPALAPVEAPLEALPTEVVPGTSFVDRR